MINNLIILYIFTSVVLCIFGICGIIEYIANKVSEFNDKRLREKYHFTYSFNHINKGE